MYNIILDRLPTDYEGYLIRTSFRIGIQICLLLKDEEFTEEERLYTALTLLYGNGVPQDIQLAVDGLSWFMDCGMNTKSESSSSKELFYWDFDSARLYSGFMSTYNIDITKEDMHWFKFVALIGSLDKDCAFNKAIEIREFDTKDLRGKALADMQRMKRDLTPPVELTEEEQANLDRFNALFDGGDVNG